MQKIASYSLLIATVILILQEDFLIEKVPYIFFYSCKLLQKTLTTREKFGESRSLNDFGLLILVCFGKKSVFDIIYYQIHIQKYLKYIIILICIDYCLLLLAKKGIKAKKIIAIEPLKTFLNVASGISDSISLENMLWSNQLSFWHLPLVFFYIVLDPLLYTLSTWIMKGQNKEKSYGAVQKGLAFGSLFTFAHFAFSRDDYRTLINLRRQIPFNTSNVMTFAVGIRLLNCFSYLALNTFDLVKPSLTTQTMIKDNFVKIRPVRKISDSSDASTVASQDSFGSDEPSLFVEKMKSD